MGWLFKVSTLANPNASDLELRIERPGWAVMRARPNFREHGQLLWVDLLAALGHDLDSSERGRASAGADIQALCWLAAGQIDDLIVAGANMLPPSSLRELCTLTSSQGVRTWLLYDIEVSDEREEAEISLLLEVVELERFFEIRRAAGTTAAADERPAFPVVPDTHFLGFIDIVREVVSPGDQAVVAECFEQGKVQMLAKLSQATEVDEDALARFLHEITVHTNNLNELTSIIKGAQTAAFMCGWQLLIDVPNWSQRGMVAALARHLEPREWSEIGSLYRPCDAATCVLSTIGVSVDEVGVVRADDVALDGSVVAHKGERLEVPESARRLLVAQHIFRDLVGSNSDKFLVHGFKSEEVSSLWAGRLLKLVTRDTGVVLRSPKARRQSMEVTTWNGRLGISITRLAS